MSKILMILIPVLGFCFSGFCDNFDDGISEDPFEDVDYGVDEE